MSSLIELSVSLSESYDVFGGLKVGLFESDKKLSYILFDNINQKIYKLKSQLDWNSRSEWPHYILDLFRKYEKTELLSYKDVSKTVLKYKYLIHDDKTVYMMTFCFLDSSGDYLLTFKDLESCFDEDRRPYELILKDYVDTCRKISRAGGWPFKDAYCERTGK